MTHTEIEMAAELVRALPSTSRRMEHLKPTVDRWRTMPFAGSMVD